MFRTRRRLRLRIALEFMLIACVINALLFAVLVRTRQETMRDRFDRELISRADAVAQIIAAGGPSPPLEELERTSPDIPTYYRVLAADGAVVHNSPGAQRIAARSIPITLPAPGTAKLTELELPEAHADPDADPMHRVAAVAVPAGEGRPSQVVMAISPLGPLHKAWLALVRLLYLFVLPTATLAAGGAAFVISHRVFRRIDAISLAASQVGSAEASRRIELPATRDEIGEMVAQMNGMLSRLEAAYAAQDKFVLDVTHELKTPVTALLGEAQRLTRRSPEQRPEEFRSFVSSVQEEMRTLGEFLESLLTLLRAGHGKFIANERVHLHEVLVEAAERWEPEARALGATLTLKFEEDQEGADADPVLRGDHGMLVRMVTNLLTAVAGQDSRVGEVELSLSRGPGEVVIRAVFRESPGWSTRSSVPAPRKVELRAAVAQGVAQIHGGSIVMRTREDGSPAAEVRLPVSLKISQAG